MKIVMYDAFKDTNEYQNPNCPQKSEYMRHTPHVLKNITGITTTDHHKDACVICLRNSLIKCLASPVIQVKDGANKVKRQVSQVKDSQGSPTKVISPKACHMNRTEYQDHKLRYTVQLSTEEGLFGEYDGCKVIHFLLRYLSIQHPINVLIVERGGETCNWPEELLLLTKH